MRRFQRSHMLLVLVCFFSTLNVWGQDGEPQTPIKVKDETNLIRITTGYYQLHILKEGFRYAFHRPDGGEIAASHPVSGLQIGKAGQSPGRIAETRLISAGKDEVELEVLSENGIIATVSLSILPNALKMQVDPREEGMYSIIAGTKGLGPVYGLADHAAFGGGEKRRKRAGTELSGFRADTLLGHRMISNFAIFPKQGFAEVNMEPGLKMLRFTEEENLQGSLQARSMPAFYYFIGSPEKIYKAFLDARNTEGYRVYKPKYAWFGVGWEAFGALAWNTNHKSVTENIDQYLKLGFPLEWMVVGSGFWPGGKAEFDDQNTPYGSESESEEDKRLQATTSFGMWDKNKYPDPEGMIEYFHGKGLKFIIGLRIGFIPGGPFTEEGLERDYFIKGENGQPRLFNVGFPRSPVYLLDAHLPAALTWYVDLCQKWLNYGVDGFKEDLFRFPQTLPDDLIDPVNEALMDQGVYIMGRNAYLGSAADIHRYDDFNYNQFQDRGPLNGLAYAYSGFPYVYPDIVGGTGLGTGRFGEDEPDSILPVYMMRYAQYAALQPSMSFGYGPWNFDEEVTRICLEAARLHDRLQPYIYSNAIKAYKTGFPYPMTPLPLAYPDDPEVYRLADTLRRSYQWMIGESLLATPLYGNDYAAAQHRDVYLPEGTWIEYDSGKAYQGPLTLKDYPLPIGKTPLFVGGSGIVTEETAGKLHARIYPVSDTGETIFHSRNGEASSRIRLQNPDWERLTVTDLSTGQEVPVTFTRHAHEFLLEPGHDYLVK